MWEDEIVAEVRRAREAHAAAHGHDLRRIFEDLKRQGAASGVPTVTLEPKLPPERRRVAAGR